MTMTSNRTREAIPESHKDIILGKNFAHLATLMDDGSPQTTPVWIDMDGGDLLVNTSDGRVKQKNLDRDGRVAISITDHANPYRYIQVRGVVDAKEPDEGYEHINKMAKKYLGQDKYPYLRPGEKRLIYRIRPESVQVSG